MYKKRLGIGQKKLVEQEEEDQDYDEEEEEEEGEEEPIPETNENFDAILENEYADDQIGDVEVEVN